MLTDNAVGSISPPTPKTLSYKSFFHIIIIIIAISICYSNTLHQEWHFDDNSNIVNSKAIHLIQITKSNIIKTFYTHRVNEKKHLYRPIPRLSFALNYYFSNLNTTSYHITNICIHILTALFAYLVFFKTLTIMDKKGLIRLKEISCQEIALLGAIFWAIHPIQTQAVTYIVQRMTSMAAMFYMMSMFFYIQFRENKDFLKKILSLCFVLICFTLAVLSKENAILLPLTIVLFEIIFLDIQIKRIKYLSFTFFIFLILTVITFSVLEGTQLVNIAEKIFQAYDQRVFTMWQRLLTEPRIMTQYLFLIFCPLADFLSYESDIIHSTGIFKPFSTFFSIIFLGLLLGFAIKYLKRFKLLCFAILFYFINHLVESTFIGLELYFVHRNYLPSIFLYLVMAYYLIKGLNFYNIQNKKIMQSLIIILITAIIISQGNATYLRNDIWQTEKSLLTNTIKKVPENVRPYISLAANYIDGKKYDEAIGILKNAEKIYKKNKKLVQKNWIGLIYYNLGIAHFRINHNEKAIHYLVESLKYEPGDWQTHSNLGYLFFKKNDLENALISYFNAYQLKNNEPMLINMYGRALYENDQTTNALYAFKNALKIKSSETIKFNIVGCYLKQNDKRSAKMEFYKIKRPSDYLNISSINYLIYKAVLFDGKSRDLAIKNIAMLLFKNQTDLCEWLERMKKNHEPGIIYPDISSIDNKLIKEYMSLLNNTNKQVETNIKKIKSCI